MRRDWIDYTVDVEAGIDEVHALLTDVRSWPSWVPGLRSLKVLGSKPVTRGTRFSMVIRLSRFVWLWLPNNVYAVEPGVVEWGGGIPGTKIRHRFELTAVTPQLTRVRQREYATTILALVCRPLERAVLALDTKWSDALRAQFATRVL